MRLAVTLSLAVLLASALPGAARAAPLTDLAPDPRIREVVYAPGEVYRVAGAFRTATQIVFSPDETIRHAAVGDSVAWEVAAEGSVLFLKPRERHGGTNLLVVTERAGLIRHYAFELTARDASERSPAAYQIRFRYPVDEQVAATAALVRRTEMVETQLIGLELQRGALEGPRNLSWSAWGAASLQPREVTDNGRFTVLRFPGTQAIPALFEVSEDGSERLVPYDVRGEFVVIHGVPKGLRLRRGRLVLCLSNDAWTGRGAATGTATASPVVDRISTGDLS
ncbi:TrbG/VirB9 family P-type conjugative transfer protein [Brevundimonas sp. FT23042]|uniref:TrbG/VirB9 family P-type conjugative transfer protein n=1 Tax=Brevundimonas sp. FT23042 TaxID=3393749 RepID=UPI003B58ADDB